MGMRMLRMAMQSRFTGLSGLGSAPPGWSRREYDASLPSPHPSALRVTPLKAFRERSATDMMQWLSWLAPTLLCVIALAQMWVTAEQPLSPWKLGGFGMYSGVDSVAARWIRPVVVVGAGELPVSFDRLLEDRPDLVAVSRAVRSWPDAGRLAAVAEALLEGEGVWADCTPSRIRKGGRVSAPFVRILPRHRIRPLGCRPLNVQALRLEIWRYDYVSDGRRLIGEKLVEAGAIRR